MEIDGVVRNGVVIVDMSTPLPEGMRVKILAPLDSDDEEPLKEGELTSLQKFLLSIAGTANDLPSDMAENHDHYIHGAPKQ